MFEQARPRGVPIRPVWSSGKWFDAVEVLTQFTS
jgi:hypothetical protein